MIESATHRNNLDVFLRKMETPMYTYVRRLLRNRDDADDVYQESIGRIRHLAARGRLRDNEREVRALLFTIARNLAVDQPRLRRWTTAHAEDAEPPRDLPLTEVVARQQIDMALDELPDAQRQALLLRVFGELTYNDIAQALDLPENDVKTVVCRARMRLTELLDADGQYVGDQTHEAHRDD